MFMKNRRTPSFFLLSSLFTFFVLFFTVLPPFPADAVYKVKPKAEKPVFGTAEEERLYRLGKGEILTDGGYLKKGVWGKMEGVIQAQPEVVWKLFLNSNEWKNYRFPNMIDSRAATDAMVKEVGLSEKVEDFYRAIGNQAIDPFAERKKGAVWTNHTFQHYDLPWPVANRWMVVKNTNDETRVAEGVYRSEWAKAAGNVRTLDGSLSLEPFDGDKNRTLLVYQIKSDPGSHVPKFLLKWGVKKTMPAAIRIIRREAAKVVRPVPLLKIQTSP
jgi:hypothetical protein